MGSINTPRFNTQSILAAETREICALEILSRRLPNFDDEVEMLELDIAALEHAAFLADRTGLRIHCNMEYSSLILAPWRRLRDHIRPGVVIELVERNELLMSQDIFTWMQEIVGRVRRNGGAIAIDDVSPNALELNVIKAFRPEIIKVCSRDGLLGVRDATGASLIIAEHIESREHAELARELGAHEIQGYWCDRIAGHRLGQLALPQADTHTVWVPA